MLSLSVQQATTLLCFHIHICLFIALKLMGELSRSWSTFIIFYSKLANTVNFQSEGPLSIFHRNSLIISVKILNSKQNLTVQTKFKLERLVMQITSMSNYLYKISTFYETLSSRYLMKEINEIGALLALNPKEVSSQVYKICTELVESCKKAQRFITDEIIGFKKSYMMQ